MLFRVVNKESKKVELRRILRMRLQEKYGLCPEIIFVTGWKRNGERLKA